jgi:hypothetical protein
MFENRKPKKTVEAPAPPEPPTYGDSGFVDQSGFDHETSPTIGERCDVCGWNHLWAHIKGIVPVNKFEVEAALKELEDSL